MLRRPNNEHKYARKIFVFSCEQVASLMLAIDMLNPQIYYGGWNFNSGNYLFTTDTK